MDRVTRVLCGRLLTMMDPEPDGAQIIEITGGQVARVLPADGFAPDS